eukprot:2095458-Amphidinium_carterae.1
MTQECILSSTIVQLGIAIVIISVATVCERKKSFGYRAFPFLPIVHWKCVRASPPTCSCNPAAWLGLDHGSCAVATIVSLVANPSDVD